MAANYSMRNQQTAAPSYVPPKAATSSTIPQNHFAILLCQNHSHRFSLCFSRCFCYLFVLNWI